MPELSLQELELELIDLLASQGLPVEEIHLIGMLGRGSRATVFSVIIDGIYHVLKVYDSKESLQAELKNLKKVIPKDRFLFWWEEHIGRSMLNIAIIEVPEGTQLTSAALDETTAERVAVHMAELHNLKYRQTVSLSALQRQLRRTGPIFLSLINQAGLDPKPFEKLLSGMHAQLKDHADLFRVQKVRIHGDLWWPNVIVAAEDVYLIDWESLSRGDAAIDVSKLRTVLYWRRDSHEAIYFWDAPKDAGKVKKLMEQIIKQHKLIAGDDTLEERLKFYLPFACIRELADRYINGVTETDYDVALNRLLADEALRLAKDPTANPPDLNKHDYFEALIAKRNRQLQV